MLPEEKDLFVAVKVGHTAANLANSMLPPHPMWTSYLIGSWGWKLHEVCPGLCPSGLGGGAVMGWSIPCPWLQRESKRMDAENNILG